MKFYNFKVKKVVFLALTVAIAILSGCTSQKLLDWRAAEKLDSIAEYEAYTRKWPLSQFTPKARQRLKTLYRDQQWRIASAKDSFAAYETFLKRYPFSPYTLEAFDGLRKTFKYEQKLHIKENWQRVRKIDSVKEYVKFLMENPHSQYIASARKRLEKIGKSPLLEAMWKKNEKTLKSENISGNKSSGGDIYTLMLPVISDDGSVYLVYKNSQYQYEKITSNGIVQLPLDYELISLRYQKPYQSFVFFVSRNLTNATKVSIDKFDKIFSKIILKYMDVLTAKFGYDFSKIELQLFLPNIPDISNSTKNNSFLKNILLHAQRGNQYKLTLQVNKPEKFSDTLVVKQLIDEHKAQIYEPGDISNLLAVKHLLYFDIPQGNKVLQAAGSKVVPPLIRLLNNKNNIIQQRAASMLTLIGSPAVIPLSKKLHYSRYRSQGSEIRLRAMSILGNIKDPAAIQPLIDLLIEWDIGPDALSTLKKLNWSPSSPEERIYTAIARRNRNALLHNWPQTKEILLADIVSRNRQKITGALYAFIAIGKKEIIQVLVDTLMKKGNKIMAETYLNSGSSRLSEAGKDWADKHGYRIFRGSGAHEVSWGSF